MGIANPLILCGYQPHDLIVPIPSKLLYFGSFLALMERAITHNIYYTPYRSGWGFQAACMIRGVKKKFEAPAPAPLSSGKRLSEGAVIGGQPLAYTISILRFFSKFVIRLNRRARVRHYPLLRCLTAFPVLFPKSRTGGDEFAKGSDRGSIYQLLTGLLRFISGQATLLSPRATAWT